MINIHEIFDEFAEYIFYHDIDNVILSASFPNRTRNYFR